MPDFVGVIDEPVKSVLDDRLGIKPYADALIEFISKTSTPITLGIQGEWGSGKTSLINYAHEHFDGKPNVQQIWLNAWEYSLLSNPEETLVKIINKILRELIVDVEPKLKSGILKASKILAEGALRITAAAALGTGAANQLDKWLEEPNAAVGDLQMQLKNLIKLAPNKKYIIYIDDLDRIDPTYAVKILELLKNIFSLPQCVFILAIDYQVVRSGLREKFGDPGPENEWQYRAFFDKLIQLPFSMPTGQYKIGDYVVSLLSDIKFITKKSNDDQKEKIEKIIKFSIGGNPRSIKRLINSVALIQIFLSKISDQKVEHDRQVKLQDDQFKLILFSLVCIQVAYPSVYEFLVSSPDFLAWDEQALVGINLDHERSESYSSDFKSIENDDDLESWQLVLYRVIYNQPRLRSRFDDIGNLFKIIRDFFEKDEHLAPVMKQILTQTSVTSVSSSADQNIHPKASARNAFNNYKDYIASLKETNSLPGKNYDIYDEILGFVEQAISEYKSDIIINYGTSDVSVVALRDPEGAACKCQLLYFKPPRKDGAFPAWLRNRFPGTDEVIEDFEAAIQSNEYEFTKKEDYKEKNEYQIQASAIDALGKEEYEVFLKSYIERVIGKVKDAYKARLNNSK